MTVRRFPKRVWVISNTDRTGRISRELVTDEDIAERYRTVHPGWEVAEYRLVKVCRGPLPKMRTDEERVGHGKE